MKNILLLLLLSFSVHAATSKYILDNEKSKMLINGTSFLHNWETKVEKIFGEGTFVLNKEKLTGIKDFYLKVETQSIKSGTESLDVKTHEALRGSTYPIIRATIKNIDKIDDSSKVEGTVEIFVGGVTQTGPFTVSVTSQVGNSLVIAGEKILSMKSFQIDPPSVMFFKAGDEVTVSFSLFLAIREDQEK